MAKFRKTELEQEQLRQTLKEGYKARRKEDAETDHEWEWPTLAAWANDTPQATRVQVVRRV